MADNTNLLDRIIGLQRLRAKWMQAKEGDSNDAEMDAAQEYIEAMEAELEKVGLFLPTEGLAEELATLMCDRSAHCRADVHQFDCTTGGAG